MIPPRVFSIGHSNHAIERFVELLRAHDMDALADVRSSPFARYATQFNAPALEVAVVAAGIRYVPMGPELGGRPQGGAFYDSEGHVMYGSVAKAPFFERGIERLIDGSARLRIAMMCAEESPIDCHRRLLIARVLEGRGIDVVHIRGNGRVQSEREVAAEEAIQHPDRVQLSLFETQEDSWRSTRSVSPSVRRPASSEDYELPESDDW